MNNINYPAPKQEYKVLVRCFTYNQSKYIEDALNGFAMQQTNFPFVCLVMDDASTDGEQDVIKSWMECECDMNKAEFIDIPTSHVVIVPHKSNLSCTFAFYLLKQNLYGTGDKKMNHVYPWRKMCEYEALCEGDDYWIDPLKLQKQVDFMESHPEHSLCFHAHYREYNDGRKELDARYNENIEICPVKDIIMGGGGYMATNSMLFRRELGYVNYPQWAQDAPVGDAPLMLVLTNRGNVCYINTPMSIYRINSIGSWTSKQSSDFKFIKNHHYKIVEMWRRFDEWTNFKYHKSIVKKLKLNKVNYIKQYLRHLLGR